MSLTERQLEHLSGQEFEDLVASLLGSMGLTITEKSTGRDGGVDLVARSSDLITGGTFIIQCKRQLASVGEPVVRDLLGVVFARKANKGILITTSEFTPSAREFAAENPIELVSESALMDMLANSQARTGGVITADAQLVSDVIRFAESVGGFASRLADRIQKQDDDLQHGLRVIKKRNLKDVVKCGNYLVETSDRLASVIDVLRSQACHFFADLDHSTPPEEVKRRFEAYEEAVCELLSLQKSLHAADPVRGSDIESTRIHRSPACIQALKRWADVLHESVERLKSVVHLALMELARSLQALVQSLEGIDRAWVESSVREGKAKNSVQWTTDLSEASAEIAALGAWAEREAAAVSPYL